MLAILAFKVTIYRHQEYYQGWNNLSTLVSKTIFHTDMEFAGSVSTLSALPWAEPGSLLWDHSSLCRQANAQAPSSPSDGALGGSPAGYQLTDIIPTSRVLSGFICSEALVFGGFALVVSLPKFWEKHRSTNCAIRYLITELLFCGSS